MSALVSIVPPMRVRSYIYGFPEAVIEPGQDCIVKVHVTGVFRAEKLVMVATMPEIRGHYRIKRSRLPALDRNDVVCAFSRVRRWSNGRATKFLPGKTVIEYRGQNRSFTREYQPQSVSYTDVDALEYIELCQMRCGDQHVFGAGVCALFFGPGVLGNGLRTFAADTTIELHLRNCGDIVVHVHASVLGAQR